jgi:DNA-binding NtrC family response regulator
VGIRRIEITAFRRAAIVFRAPSGPGSSSSSPPEGEPAEPTGTVSLQGPEVDSAQVQVTSVDVARSPELTLLMDALMKHDGDIARAANQLGLTRSDLISKLCGFSFSVK